MTWLLILIFGAVVIQVTIKAITRIYTKPEAK
jgi:hypothetical protein